MSKEPRSPLVYSPAQLKAIDDVLRDVCEAIRCEFKVAADGAIIPWSGLILGAAERYVSLSDWTQESDEYRSDMLVLFEQILRSLSDPNPDRALAAELLGNPADEIVIDVLTHGLIEQGYDLPYDAALADARVPIRALAGAVVGARAFLHRPDGRIPETVFDEWVAELADLYYQMTGRWPGRGYARPPEALPTPFERLALAVIPPIRAKTGLEAIRGSLRRVTSSRQRALTIGCLDEGTEQPE
jgi:hypothetical protein